MCPLYYREESFGWQSVTYVTCLTVQERAQCLLGSKKKYFPWHGPKKGIILSNAPKHSQKKEI